MLALARRQGCTSLLLGNRRPSEVGTAFHSLAPQGLSWAHISGTRSRGRVITSGTQGLSLLLPARGEKVGMRGPLRESEPAETPPHRAEFWFSSVPRGPLPASGYRMHTFDSLHRLACKQDSSHFNDLPRMLAHTLVTEGASANPLDLSRFSRCVNPIALSGGGRRHLLRLRSKCR